LSVSSGDSELVRMSSGWITSPSLSKFGGSYSQGFQTCPFYKHTGQDRRIQKEMASTHTKNATKPNSSKILQLQTARKKINWTT